MDTTEFNVNTSSRFNINKSNSGFDYFFAGLTLVELFNLLNSLFSSPILRIPSSIGIILIILSIIYLFKKRTFHKTTLIVKAYIVWNIITCFRFEEISYEELRLALYQQKHLLSYLVPIIFFLPNSISLVKIIFKWSILFCIISISLYITLRIFTNTVTDKSSDLILSTFIPGSEILLLTYVYQKKNQRYLSILTILIAILAAAITGRRSIIIAGILFIFARVMLDIIYSKDITKKNILAIAALTATLTLLISFEYIMANFEALQSRVYTDSRSNVYVSFINDLKGFDWVIGRGIDGKYYNPMTYWSLIDDSYREIIYRDNIENGFLYHILKGGIISIVMFMYISLKAIHLGLYRSNNILSKAFAIYILIYIIQMISFGQPSLSIKYVFVWLSISFCFSKNFRTISENVLKEQIRH